MFIAQHQSRDLWLYGDRLLCNFMPFNFKEGISSQDVFAREICTIIFSEITHTPPSKVKWSAPKFGLLNLIPPPPPPER